MHEPTFSLALVTGASSGIGAAVARLLAKKGIPLILNGRDFERLNAVAEELAQFVPIETIIADLSKKEERQKVVALIRGRTPDLVVNNAGFGLYGEACDLPIDKQMEMLEVDGAAVLELSMEAGKALKEAKKKGIILNVSSVAGFFNMPLFTVYSSVKSFVNSFSESLDFELQPYGIRVLASCPGMVSTNFGKTAGAVKKGNSLGQVMTVEFAAEQIWIQICKQKPIHIFSWQYRLAVRIFSLFVSKTFLMKYLKKNIENRYK